MTDPTGRTARLDPAVVVAEAVRVLDERGLESVSLRAVADRLGVRMNTVLWHVKSKARLREMMADAIIGEVGFEDLPGRWDRRLRELLHRLRRVLLSHPDGAVLVAGAHAADPHALRFAEEITATLLRAGFGTRETSWAVWTLLHLVSGLVQEEQAPSSPDLTRLRAEIAEERFPALHSILGDASATDFAARFDFAVTAQLTALRDVLLRNPPEPGFRPPF
ncbi:TetR/AcrR family transcriptional regulator C-terminal domain-containing protein [Saccharopolyspora sp. MS10]|uniref:TetR/AcrR family transcriptional regulator C-terminal domain-containing protein n=1 Tax=Saccharopolyspora sp. MS10 TaxID=3385973 RepID=UPI0039A0CACC